MLLTKRVDNVTVCGLEMIKWLDNMYAQSDQTVSIRHLYDHFGQKFEYIDINAALDIFLKTGAIVAGVLPTGHIKPMKTMEILIERIGFEEITKVGLRTASEMAQSIVMQEI